MHLTSTPIYASTVEYQRLLLSAKSAMETAVLHLLYRGRFTLFLTVPPPSHLWKEAVVGVLGNVNIHTELNLNYPCLWQRCPRYSIPHYKILDTALNLTKAFDSKILPGPDNMALMVPDVSACSRFTMNSCWSWDTSFTNMASGPSQPPICFSSSPLSSLVSDMMCTPNTEAKKTQVTGHSPPSKKNTGKYLLRVRLYQ